jgi:two-component system, OmpR family, copper resistance phosphate regulon response regulator CusR
MRILVVEDDKKVAGFIQQGLKQEHHAVDVVNDGETAAYQAGSFGYDLVILDLMLPRLPGLEVLQRIRSSKPGLPVLILTAKSDLQDKIAGLDSGADDYLIKPFAYAELSARVRALLRRAAKEDVKFRVADLEMDTTSRTVMRGGRQIELKPKEYALLELLLRNAHTPVTRNMIIEHVWDIHFDAISNVVDVHINWLRNKVDKGFSPPLIHTLRGVGYVLTDKRS